MSNPLEGGRAHEKKEAEKFVMRSRLHIFRHGQKAGGNDVSQEEDLVMELKPIGKTESMEAGKAMERLPDAWSLAVGSPRLRARQTAAFTRAGNNPEITGEESLSELNEKTGDRHTWTDSNLDMPFIKGVTPHFDELLEAYKNNRYLIRLRELYEEASPEERLDSTYATQVRQIATLIDRQIRLNQKLGERHDYHESSAPNKTEAPEALERFFGTHGSVTESFVIEMIRRVKGEEEAQKFMAALPNGMTYNEGIQVDIESVGGGEPRVRITFAAGPKDHPYQFDATMKPEVVTEILKEFSPAVSEESDS